MTVTIHPSSLNDLSQPRVHRGIRNLECHNGRIVMFYKPVHGYTVSIESSDKFDVDPSDGVEAA